MNIKPIKTEADYNKALKRLEKLFDAKANTPTGDEAEVLSILVEHFENEHYAIDEPDPIEAIKIRMEEMGMKQADLALMLGSKSRVSEILNKQRKLNLPIIRQLVNHLHLSPNILLQDYELNDNSLSEVAEPNAAYNKKRK